MPDENYDPSAGPDEDDLEDDGVLDASDTLDGDPGDDPLDTGIAPPDRWSAGERFGTTPSEERQGESLDQLLAEEEPEADPYAEEEPEADPYAEDDLATDAVPGDEQDARSGRLVAEDEGAHPDTERDLVARDVGIDGGAAGAEEAAVHIQDEPGGATGG
jgi:Family of unknown function (DUF5709)